MTLEPSVRFDQGALNAAIVRAVTPLVVAPVNATLAGPQEGFTSTSSRLGRTLSVPAIEAAAAEQLDDLDAPAELRVPVAARQLDPLIDDADAASAIAAADRMAVDVEIAVGEERWPIRATTIRTWIGISTSPGDCQGVGSRSGGDSAGRISRRVDVRRVQGTDQAHPGVEEEREINPGVSLGFEMYFGPVPDANLR